MKQTTLCVLLVVFVCSAYSSTSYANTKRIIVNPHSGGQASVEYTAQGVPFITATNEEDLFFTQGYVVAENRLWQMEIFRRWGLGTLAEIFPDALRIDMSSRRMQWAKVCNENIINTPQKYLDTLQNYVNGVNSFLQAASADPTLMPPEYEQYNVPFPSDFVILDTYIILKLLSTGLSGNAGSEPKYQQMVDTVGLARFNQYYAPDPNMPYIAPPYHHSNYSRAGEDISNSKQNMNMNMDMKMDITMENMNGKNGMAHCGTDAPIPKTSELSRILPFLINDDYEMPHRDTPQTLEEFLLIFRPEDFTRASNSWAVGGEHTTTGLPLFANDPHLVYTAPMVWVIVGLHIDAPDSTWNHVVGATFVLAPGVGIGRNDKIAWGYTMVQADTQDLFIMQNLPGNTAYKYNGTVIQYDISSELINVKDQEPYNITLYRSVYGPVIPDNDGTYYALNWTAQYYTDTSVEALLDQCQATTKEEYLQAISKWWSMCFNAVYADIDGNIGYHGSGGVPIRQNGDTGQFPQIGDGSMDWLGFRDFDSLENFENPDEGFIVTANNPVAPPESSFNIVGSTTPGFRAQRIIDMIVDAINAGTLMDVDYMQSIQGSVVDLEFSYLYSTIEHLQLV